MTFDEKIIHIGKSANGKILSEWLRDNGYMILQPCGGRGTCGKCLVKVINGVFLMFQIKNMPNLMKTAALRHVKQYAQPAELIFSCLCMKRQVLQ